MSHLDDTKLERTAFVLGSGPGLTGKVPRPRVVDILPTVLHQLGLRTPARWNVDGRSLTRSRPPSSAFVRARGRGGAKRLVARLRFGAAARRARAVVLRLPASVRLLGTAAEIRARVNGGPAAFVRLAGRRTVTVRPGRKRLRKLTLSTVPGTLRGKGSGEVTLSLRGPKGSRGRLRAPLVAYPRRQ